MSLRVKADKGRSTNRDLRQLLISEVYPRLGPEGIFTHPAHRWKEKTSAKWKGGCPWHESTSGTAFYVEIDEPPYLWRCPQCDVGGDAISYLWKLERGVHAGEPTGRDFIDLVRRLCQQAGVQLPEAEMSADAIERLRLLRAREAILADAYAICRGLLESPQGKQARAYLHQRGIDATWREELQLGLYPSMDALREQLRKRGHQPDDIQAASVITPKLVGYITFPWWDESGHPLGLYGRWPGDPPAEKPKQCSASNPRDEEGERLDRTKRSPLYLNRALRAAHTDLVLVEGLLDAAVLQAQGESCAVSCVAALLSKEQLETLARRKVKSVTICLDPDAAGDKAIRSNVERLRAKGITPYVAPRLPDKQDPDEFVLEHGIDAWRQRLRCKVHGFRHIAQSIIAGHGERLGPGDDAWTEGVIEAALAFAADQSADHDHELGLYFWEEILQAAGGNPEDLRARLRVLRVEKATSKESTGFRWQPMASDAFAAADFKPSWLVPRLLVRNQPGVIGGPKKVLKTTLLVDLAVSLASGTPFLGYFDVRQSVRVVILSGESGEFTLQETARRVCAARGLELASLGGKLSWMFDLPQLATAADMKALQVGLEQDHPDVLLLDPLYLSLLAGQAPGAIHAENLYEMGPLLRQISKACLDCGVTPLFAHHAKKHVGKTGEPIDLDDLAFAGIAEFARQWLLVSRRKPYQKGTGRHELWLEAGGSVGHGGLWSVDIEEAIIQEDFTGRKWEVEVTTAPEEWANQENEKKQQKNAKRQQANREDEDTLLATLDRLDPHGRGVSHNRVKRDSGLSRDRMQGAFDRLVQAGVLERISVVTEVGNGAQVQATGMRRRGDEDTLAV